jgi:hypothetical protein
MRMARFLVLNDTPATRGGAMVGPLLAGQLFGVAPYDAFVLAAAAAVLSAAVVLAAAVPAHRAAGVDSNVALREE